MKTTLLAGVAVLTLCAGSAWAREGVESRADMRGVTVLVGGGVEGYTSTLGSDLNPGVAYGATVALRPTKVLGLELGYTGSVHTFDRNVVSTSNTWGPDVIRNGAQAVATLGLTAAPIQPYVLAGVGLSRYDVRGTAAGFHDDTVGNVPLGGGLRLHMGSFTADARLDYNVLFDQQFASNVPTADVSTPLTTFSKGGSYVGTLNFGATW